jgi:hypothetical protein
MVHNELQYEFIYQYVHYYFNSIGIEDTRSIIRELDKEQNDIQEEPTQEGEPSEDDLSQKEENEGESMSVDPEEKDEDNPDLKLDMINKPPPIERGKKKSQFLF